MPEKTPKPLPEEVLLQYSELARGRELFIKLFPDSSTLINLGYTSKQITFAEPAIQLIEDEGYVDTKHNYYPILSFPIDYRNSRINADIYFMPKSKGYYFNAERTVMSFVDELTLLMRGRLTSSQYVFEEFSPQVVDITLVDPAIIDITNIDVVVPAIFQSESLNSKIPKENIITKIGNKVGLQINSYTAAWTDETKLEFALRYTEGGGDPIYLILRRLSMLEDDKGKVVPFGRKANFSNQQKVESILKNALEKKTVVQGKFASEPS